jgi:two-component system cell cycle sensor histidine kinase/response regulator CckA
MSDPVSMNTAKFEEKDSFFQGFNEALLSMEAGILRYGENSNLLYASEKAYEFFPDLNHPQKGLGNIKLFFAFVYDHSLEWQDQAALTTQWAPLGGFQEIVRLESGRTLLARILRQSEEETTVILSDISLVYQRTQALLQANEQNKILLDAVEASPNGIFIADAQSDDFPILFVNTSISLLLGGGERPLVGSSLREELMEKFSNQREEIRTKLNLRTGMTLWKFINSPKGGSNWFELQIFPLLRGTKVTHLIGFLSDQTEMKIREEQIAQSHKLEAIGQLAGGVAHDFNNILSIIEGYSRMAQSAHKKGKPIDEMLEKIQQASKRGSGLTRRLLTFGRLRIAEEEVIDLGEELLDMEALLDPLVGATFDLIMPPAEEKFWIKGTHDSMVQIVMNLVINARDAMPQGGDIIVTTIEEDKGGYVLLSVEDSGTGMDEATIQKIFDPFFTTKSQGKGTGLGLSTVYGLVKQLGGEITVQSEVGKGTKFVIKLPLVKPVVHHENKEKESEDNSTSLLGKTVLLAEDEPELLHIMADVLGEFGLHVLSARNGNEALVIQDSFEGPIDFLLTDMVMPELGGLKLAELMKDIRPETAIVFMSGYPVRGDQAEVVLPEDAIFLAKPVAPENLRQVLESISLGKGSGKKLAPHWQ